jgi:hypothetical protein
MSSKIGIVVPTIGERPDYLPQTLESIRSAGDCYILLVGRTGFDPSEFISSGLIDKYVDETDQSLPGKINQGFSELPDSVEYINWLGDDDLLMPGSMDLASFELENNPASVLVYGGCQYINSVGSPIWHQGSGKFAISLLRFGPQLIPQPGSLYRRDKFEEIGGLSLKYSMAFDFDLFYRLSEVGECVFLPKTLSCFRWHPGSLSVKNRSRSVREASEVRRSHLPKSLELLSYLWEVPVILMTFWAGRLLTRRLVKKS